MMVEVLASLRVARLVSSDTITAPARDRLFALSQDHRAAGWVLDLLGCPWCVSIWSSAAVVALTRTRIGRMMIRGLAVAEVTGILLADGPMPVRMTSPR